MKLKRSKRISFRRWLSARERPRNPGLTVPPGAIHRHSRFDTEKLHTDLRRETMSTAHIPIAKSVEKRPAKRVAAAQRIYLYAIIAGGQDRAWEELGIDQHKLY